MTENRVIPFKKPEKDSKLSSGFNILNEKEEAILRTHLKVTISPRDWETIKLRLNHQELSEAYNKLSQPIEKPVETLKNVVKGNLTFYISTISVAGFLSYITLPSSAYLNIMTAGITMMVSTLFIDYARTRIKNETEKLKAEGNVLDILLSLIHI